MKILKISLDKSEEDQIFNWLTSTFDLNNSEIFNKRGQTINTALQAVVNGVTVNQPLFELDANLELYQSGYKEPETNAEVITERNVVKFRLTFYYDNEEIEVVMDNRCGSCIEDRINDFYMI